VFDWDIANVRHIALHGVTRREAEEVFRDDPTDAIEQNEDGEIRFYQVGLTEALRCLVVVTTWRKEKLRVVTAYQASRSLQKSYFAER